MHSNPHLDPDLFKHLSVHKSVIKRQNFKWKSLQTMDWSHYCQCTVAVLCSSSVSQWRHMPCLIKLSTSLSPELTRPPTQRGTIKERDR